MALDLGQLAKKLLVNPIVSVGKAIGRDYKSTVFGADWRERAIMRRRMAEAKLAESASRIERDREETGYTRSYREAQTAKLTEEGQAKALTRKALERRASSLSMSPEDYEANRIGQKAQIEEARDRARIELLNAQTDSQRAAAQGKLAWIEEGLPSLVERNLAGAAASRHSAERPFSEPSSPSSRARLSNTVRDLAIVAHRGGKLDKLKSILSPYGRTAIINTFGEDSPIVAALAEAPDQ